MKALLFVLLSTLTAATFAAGTAKSATNAVSLAERERQRIVKQGGELMRRGAFIGKVVVVDAQERLAFTNLQAIAKVMADTTGCNFLAVRGKGESPARLKQAHRAQVVVTVVDDPSAPVSLVAMEEHWGTVNVAKLVDDLPSESAKRRFFESRGRKEVLRVLSVLCGGASSQFKGNVMNAATMREVDFYDEGIPVDMRVNYRRHLGSIGVTPSEKTTYLHACREGWAPAPTNATQKAIWDEVHAMPTEPLEIKAPKSAKKK